MRRHYKPNGIAIAKAECFHFLLSRRTYYDSVESHSHCPLFRIPTEREERREKTPSGAQFHGHTFHGPSYVQ